MDLEWSQDARERFLQALLADPLGQLLIACALVDMQKRSPKVRSLVKRLLAK